MTYNYTRGFHYQPLPKTKAEARECWEQIEGSMSDECISQDGEATQAEAKQNYRDVLRDALRLHKKFPHPKDILLELWNDKDARLFGYKDHDDYYETWKKAKGFDEIPMTKPYQAIFYVSASGIRTLEAVTNDFDKWLEQENKIRKDHDHEPDDKDDFEYENVPVFTFEGD